MAGVFFSGRMIIDELEGGWTFSPGATGNNAQIVAFTRNRALKVREMATSGCVHRLSVDYVGTYAGCRSYIDRISSLYDYTVGMLSVPSFGNFPSCVFTGTPSFSPVMALSDNKYMLTAELEIQQLI